MKLTTKRLILRNIKLNDKDSIRKHINNLNVSRYLLTVPYPYTKKDAKCWVNHCKEKQKEKLRTSYELGIIIKPNKEVVGGVCVSKVDRDQGTADIGYWIAEPYWGQGYVSEAVTKLIDFAFSKLKLRRLTIPVFVKNVGSNSLAKKLGFKYVGTLRKACMAKSTGKIHDENVYSMLKSEWKRKKEVKKTSHFKKPVKIG